MYVAQRMMERLRVRTTAPHIEAISVRRNKFFAEKIRFFREYFPLNMDGNNRKETKRRFQISFVINVHRDSELRINN